MIARRRWQSLAEIALCSGFPTQLALSGLALLAGVPPTTPDGVLALPFVAVVSTTDAVVLTALVLWLLRRRGESPRALFLGVRPVWREAGLGLALAPVVLAVMSGGMWWLRQVWPALHTVPENPLEAMARTPAGALVLFGVAVFAGGVREELQRAFLLHRFRTDLGGAASGLVIAAVLFGMGHLVQGWDAVIVTAALGLVWGLLYLARGSVVAAMVSHALANGVQVVIAHVQGS